MNNLNKYNIFLFLNIFLASNFGMINRFNEFIPTIFKSNLSFLPKNNFYFYKKSSINIDTKINHLRLLIEKNKDILEKGYDEKNSDHYNLIINILDIFNLKTSYTADSLAKEINKSLFKNKKNKLDLFDIEIIIKKDSKINLSKEEIAELINIFDILIHKWILKYYKIDKEELKDAFNKINYKFYAKLSLLAIFCIYFHEYIQKIYEYISEPFMYLFIILPLLIIQELVHLSTGYNLGLFS